MNKIHFRTAALRVLKTSIDVEKQKSKQITSSQVVTASVLNETLTSYLESARNYIKFVYERVSAHRSGKSNLVKGPASYNFSALFLLLEEQATSYYASYLKNLSAKRWVARELRKLLIENFMDLVDVSRFIYIDPTVGEMVAFLWSCLETCQKNIDDVSTELSMHWSFLSSFT